MTHRSRRLLYVAPNLILWSLAALVLFAPQAHAEFELQLLHASDQEGNVQSVDNAPNFAAIFDYFDDTYPNTLILTSGDVWIPGTFLNAGQDRSMRDILRDVLDNDQAREGAARADLAINTIVGFQASTFGNHEFDKGTAFIEDTIIPDIRDDDGDGVLDQPRTLGADFPYLSANLDFSGDDNIGGVFTDDVLFNTDFAGSLDDLAAAADKPKIAPSCLIEVNGETFGVVGATTPVLEQISSPGDTAVKNPGAGANDMTDLASILQPYIDELVGLGVNKIILLSHMQQLTLEQELIPLLRHVDICIGGGSDEILVDANDTLRPGDVPFGTYPLVTANADGDPALIVNTDGQYLYVGRLVVTFDDAGVIMTDSLDADINGAYPSTDAQVSALWGDLTTPFAEGSKGAKVKQITDGIETVIISKDSETWGWSDVFMNGERSDVRTQQTNLGVVSAKANLAEARKVDDTVVASIKNGGGIRASIGEILAVGTDQYEQVPPQANDLSGKQTGQVSTLDIENALSFNNGLTLLTLTAQGLLDVLNHGVAAYGPGVVPGQFAQVAGLAFSFDPELAPGDRVRSVALIDDDGTVIEEVAKDGAPVDPAATYRIVTLGFLAGGGDSYPFEELGSDFVDLEAAEQEALKNYLTEHFPSREAAYANMDTSEEEDTIIQNLAFRNDTVSGDDDDDSGCVMHPSANFSPLLASMVLLSGLLVLRRRNNR